MLVDHCNLSCDGCSALSPELDKKFASIESFEKDIQELSKHCHYEWIELLGGEPTLHKHIDEFIRIAKQYNIADRVHVTTNGVRLPKMTDYFYSNVSYLTVNYYPNTHINHAEIDQFVIEKQKQFGFIYDKRPTNTFNKMYRDVIMTNPMRLQYTYDNCIIVQEWKCQIFREGVYYKCGPPSVYHLKDPTYDKLVDGIEIHKDNFKDRLTNYLEGKKYLEACKVCQGLLGPEIPHQQIKIYKKNRVINT